MVDWCCKGRRSSTTGMVVKQQETQLCQPLSAQTEGSKPRERIISCRWTIEFEGCWWIRDAMSAGRVELQESPAGNTIRKKYSSFRSESSSQGTDRSHEMATRVLLGRESNSIM